MGNGIVKYLRVAKDAVLDLIYPASEECILCGEEIEETLLCKKCSEKISFCDGEFYFEKEGINIKYYTVAYYSGIMMELIIRLKYKSDFDAGQSIAYHMVEKIKKERIEFDFLTYVPSSKEAFKKRGYVPTAYLAKSIKRILEVEMVSVLKKTRKTKDQIGLDSESRWSNLMNSFAVINKKKIENKRILLIDDVITTGATIFYCIEELKKCGAKSIIVLTAAKSKI